MGTSSSDYFPSEGGTALFAPYPWGAVQHLLRLKDPTSGFHSGSTAEQVAAAWNGAGKTVVITGASTGLGLEAARVLAARGAHVVMGVRDMDKAKRNADVIRQRQPGARLTLLPLDLASLGSVRNFAKAVLGLEEPINVLMLNAGVAACPCELTKEGCELQLGTNHLGHHLLTRLLLPSMLQTARAPGAPEGRIVVLSSVAHFMWTKPSLALEAAGSTEGYKPWPMYGRSKLCNVLFTRQLAEQLKGEPIAVACLHPGNIRTDIVRHWPQSFTTPLILGMAGPFMKSVAQGAATQVYLATAPTIKRSEYYADCRIVATSKLSHSRALAKQLWDWSETACKKFLQPL